MHKVIKNLCVFLCQDVTHTPLFADQTSKRTDILSFTADTARQVAAMPLKLKEEAIPESKEVVNARVIRRGAVAAFAQLSSKFGKELFEKVPKLWQSVSDALLRVYPFGETSEQGDAKIAADPTLGQDLLDGLTVLREMAPTLHEDLLENIDKDIVHALLWSCTSDYSVVRQAASKCLAVICDVKTIQAMGVVVTHIPQHIGHPNSLARRLGGG